MGPSNAAIAGAGSATNQSAPEPGSLFGVPLYGTQPRIIPDSGNSAIGETLSQSSQTTLPTTRLDQLDIVRGMKLNLQSDNTWTAGSLKTLTVSPWAPANMIAAIEFQLQAAYKTYRLTGALAAAFQAFRPMWGSTGVGTIDPDNFATFGSTVHVEGTATPENFIIDIPFAMNFDEYFDLTPEGAPANRYYDALVGVQYMAAQSRVIVPTITYAAGISTSDLYNSPVAAASGDTTSTYTGQVGGSAGVATMYRDAFWTGQNPASNPPEYAWMYTRDYFKQPTNGQAQSNALIQNTGVSVGQVLSLCTATWDPAADSAKGAPVGIDAIDHFEIVTGGTLQNRKLDPYMVIDRMRSLYGSDVATNLSDAGFFVFDFAKSECGNYFSNKDAINTYVTNGVQLTTVFKSGSTPGSTAATYVGVEALKLATS